MKYSGKFSVSCSSYTYDAYVVCHSSIEGKFSNFSRFTHTPIQLGWSQELLQEYLLFMQNAISHAQLNVLKRIIAMLTSAADLIDTCACAQEVQFKWILVADLGFSWQCVYPSNLRDASLSQSMGTSQAGQNKFTFFFSLDVYLRSRWDYQPSSSSYLTSSGWYRWQ